jgi:hypothetical protein
MLASLIAGCSSGTAPQRADLATSIEPITPRTGDTIWERESSTTKVITRVEILELEPHPFLPTVRLLYRTIDDNEMRKISAEWVPRIELADRTELNDAELRFSQNRWQEAADAYDKLLRDKEAPARPWVRVWAAHRRDVAIARYREHELATRSKDEAVARRAASHRVRTGDLVYRLIGVWNTNAVNRHTLGVSHREQRGLYLMVDVVVTNEGDLPQRIPVPVLRDQRGRLFEPSRMGTLANDTFTGYERINPDGSYSGTLVFDALGGHVDGLELVVRDARGTTNSIPLD